MYCICLTESKSVIWFLYLIIFKKQWMNIVIIYCFFNTFYLFWTGLWMKAEWSECAIIWNLMLQIKYNRLIIIPGFFSKQIKSSAVFAGFTAFYSELNIISGLYLQFFNSKITDSFSINKSTFLIDFPCNKFPIRGQAVLPEIRRINSAPAAIIPWRVVMATASAIYTHIYQKDNLRYNRGLPNMLPWTATADSAARIMLCTLAIARKYWSTHSSVWHSPNP